MIRLILILSFLVNSVIGQNLIENPSFEEYENCPSNYYQTYRKYLVPSWRVPARTTPDYFNRCGKSKAKVPGNFAGYSEPISGNAYAGLIIFQPGGGFGGSEYLQTHFKKPLVADSLYRVSFYYQLSSNSIYSCNGLGVLISTKKVKTRKYFLDYDATSMIKNPIKNKGSWNLFCFEYKAKGGEEYLTIGRFSKYDQTISKELKIEGIRKSNALKEVYVYIDDVSVESSVNGCKSQKNNQKGDTLYLNRYQSIFLLKDSIYFSEIREKLLVQKGLKIYIKGEKSNSKELLQKFLKNGILPSQIILEEGEEEEFKLSF
jgi:OOP family OmpA-OmpF porin